MSKALPSLSDLNELLDLLERTRLELVEAIAARNPARYDDNDVKKLAMHAGAVQSVREAIAFRKRIDT